MSDEPSGADAARLQLLTVGHGTAAAAEFGRLLQRAQVRTLVDIRIAPGSRRHPHFGRDELARWLPDFTVSYRWERRLGGFRKPAPDSPDVALRNPSFRGYAGWMRGDDFRLAVAGVIEDAAARRTAVMCSESMWWRCHRRLVADYVTLVCELAVAHLMPDGSTTSHLPTEGARREGDVLVYDTGALFTGRLDSDG